MPEKVPSVLPEVHVAVGVIIRDGRVLIARRPEHAHQGGLLEFPGGKVEPGETVQQALVREIAEETGLKLIESALQPVIGIRHNYGDKRVFWTFGRPTPQRARLMAAKVSRFGGYCRRSYATRISPQRIAQLSVLFNCLRSWR